MVGKRQTHEQTGSIWREVGPSALGARDGAFNPKGVWEEVTQLIGDLKIYLKKIKFISYMLAKVEQSYMVYNKISGALLYLTPL